MPAPATLPAAALGLGAPGPARAAARGSGAPARSAAARLGRTAQVLRADPGEAPRELPRLYGEEFQAAFGPDAPGGRVSGSFVQPNEHHPERARAILEAAPEGLYVAVGTERGFIGAALAPRVTRLLLSDRDGAVVEYNMVNIALLRLARGREEYLRLRQKAKYEEIARLASERVLPGELRALLADRRVWSRWRSRQGGNPLNLPPRQGYFKGSNYLYDDALFARLKTMADSGRIAAVRAELGREMDVERIARGAEAAGAPVAVLDISNAWWSGYLPRRAMRSMLTRLAAAAAPDAVLLVTDRGWGDWTYHGFDLADVSARWERWRRRFDKLVSGRLSPPGTLERPER